MTDIIYQSTNTDFQTIDTFELPELHSINYEIHIITPTEDQVSSLSVIHDGVTTSEIQKSFTQTNTAPIDIY